MLCKRIIPCLDVDAGRTVKGTRFQQLRAVGEPVELARRYQDEGADELVFLDISATVEGRETMVSVVERVADVLSIPFAVGGGVASREQARRLLRAGADKVTINSAAVARPELLSEIAGEFGAQCCVLAIDARRLPDGCWQVMIHGGRSETGIDVRAWAEEGVLRGAGELLLTSWDQDGTRSGFDLALTRSVAGAVPVPVIASGGAAGPASFIEVFSEGKADAALAAGIFHDGLWTIAALKRELSAAGIEVRPC